MIALCGEICKIAAFYAPLYTDIFNSILSAPVLHIDETTVRLRKQQGYVWVLTTLDSVYYLYAPHGRQNFCGTCWLPFGASWCLTSTLVTTIYRASSKNVLFIWLETSMMTYCVTRWIKS